MAEVTKNDRLHFVPKYRCGKEVERKEQMDGNRNDRLKGLSYTELSKKYHIDPADGEAVRGVAPSTGIHTVGIKTNKTG